MKKKAILLSILSLFVLSGCNFFDTVRGWFKKKEPTQEQQDNEDSDAGYIDTKQVGEFYGGVVINDKYNGYHLGYLSIKYLFETLDYDDFKKLPYNIDRIKEYGNDIVIKMFEYFDKKFSK